MRAGYWPQHGDQHIENSTGGNGIAKQGNGNVTTSQIFGHDARPDNGCQQKKRP